MFYQKNKSPQLDFWKQKPTPPRFVGWCTVNYHFLDTPRYHMTLGLYRHRRIPCLLVNSDFWWNPDTLWQSNLATWEIPFMEVFLAGNCASNLRWKFSLPRWIFSSHRSNNFIGISIQHPIKYAIQHTIRYTMRYTHYSPYYLPEFTILQHYSPLFTTIDHSSPLVFPRFSGSSPSADTGAAGSGEPGESSEVRY